MEPSKQFIQVVPGANNSVGTRPVYVVDEDRTLRRLMFGFLSAHEFTPRAFATAQDFLDNLPHLAPGCLLVGKLSADLDTLCLIDALGDRIVEFPVVVTASHGDVSAAVQAMKRGASDVLESQFDRDVLPALLALLFVELEQRSARASSVRQAKASIQALSAREREVLDCLRKGYSNKRTAQQLGLSVRTVEEHRKSMMRHLRADHLSDALRVAFEAELSDQPPMRRVSD